MADSVSQEEQRFSLQEVFHSFRLCLSHNKEVYLEHYVAGWRGLVKFLNSLGSDFTFISQETLGKIQILTGLLSGDNGPHYASVQSMVDFELSGQLVDLSRRGAHPESGCRTLLRLHRALRWLQLFLERLRTSGEDGKTSAMCAEAYERSLSRHHPPGVRAAVEASLWMLPGRDDLFQVMNAGSPEQVAAMLGQALPLIEEVYQITEDLYAQHNLLDLP